MGDIISNKYSMGVLENTLIGNYQPMSFLMTKPYFRKNRGYCKRVFKEEIKVAKENGYLGRCITNQSLSGLAKQILDKYINQQINLLSISILNTKTEETFLREVSDVTKWEEYYIISWKN